MALTHHVEPGADEDDEDELGAVETCRKCEDELANEDDTEESDCDACADLCMKCRPVKCQGECGGLYAGCKRCLDELECGHVVCANCAEDADQCEGCGHRQCSFCAVKAFRGNCGKRALSLTAMNNFLISSLIHPECVLLTNIMPHGVGGSSADCSDVQAGVTAYAESILEGYSW